MVNWTIKRKTKAVTVKFILNCTTLTEMSAHSCFDQILFYILCCPSEFCDGGSDGDIEDEVDAIYYDYDTCLV